MADLAFVVLFFFVITIVPSEETGFLMKMEGWSEEPPSSVRVKSRNILYIGISYNNDLHVRGDTASFETLKSKVIEFVSNPNKSPELAENTWQAKIYFHYERETSYEDFMVVMGIVKAAYWELWEKEAMARFKQHYSKLTTSERRFIRGLIPFSFEEAIRWYCGY